MGKGEEKNEKIETNPFLSFFFPIFSPKRRNEKKRKENLKEERKKESTFQSREKEGEKEKILNLETRKIGEQGLKCENWKNEERKRKKKEQAEKQYFRCRK